MEEERKGGFYSTSAGRNQIPELSLTSAPPHILHSVIKAENSFKKQQGRQSVPWVVLVLPLQTFKLLFVVLIFIS